MNITLHTPRPEDMPAIETYVKEYVLDSEALHHEQFVIARSGSDVVGFGRLRHHGDSVELCTLGVVEQHRGKGIGSAIVNELVKKAGNKVHVVCIIPGFFRKFGFNEVNEYPASVARKHSRCTTDYPVPEKYCVMARS
jgi:N-acetylglutamate synthase-like GNAT family acetyltransferase